MLTISFTIGEDKYAIDSSRIIEVIPWVKLKKLPHSPDFVAGLLNYRGIIAPVIDLTQLMVGRFSKQCLSTRIILVDYYGKSNKRHTLGILVERVMESQSQEESSLIDSGVRLKDAPYLGSISIEGDEMVQTVMIEDLLPVDLQDILFVDHDD